MDSTTPSHRPASSTLEVPSPFPLPPELIDLLASFILHPGDLLPLAMTSSIFYRVVSPFHLRYRHVRCSLEDGTMWRHLEECPRRTDAIRFLHIQESSPERSLGPFKLGIEGVRIPLPPTLLARMKNLHSFKWVSRSPPRTLSASEANPYRESLFGALSKLRSLADVSVTGAFSCAESCSKGNTAPSQVSILHNL